MKNEILFLSLLILSGWSCQAQDPYLAYIDEYKELAIKEEIRTGIPASIKMAQALLESGAGQSKLATKANNHFGIKCGSNWEGRSYRRKDDDRNRLGFRVKSCFRVYPDVRSSFIDHSEFLRDPAKRSRYGFLFDIPAKDYKKWAKGLKKSGYATNSKYDKLLINLVKKYDLDKLDEYQVNEEVVTSLDEHEELIVEEIDDEPEVSEPSIKDANTYINEVWYTKALPGETLMDISKRTNIPTHKLLRFNEGLDAIGETLTKDMTVFLQAKRKNYRGGKDWHKVAEGDNMYEISQMYGLQLDALYKRNAMQPGTEPAVGEKIKINGSVLSISPRLRGSTPVTDVFVEMTPEPELEMETEGPAEEFIPEEPQVKTEVPIAEEEIAKPAAPAQSEKVYPSYYLVKKGDTLWRIAKKFQVTVDQIRGWNQLESDQISIGMRLRVG